MPRHNYQICTSCVMDTTDSMIIFDRHGVCDHCNTFKKVTLPNWNTGTKGKAQLEVLVDAIKREGKGKDFDCIIGMSGGIDSSYLTYIAKEQMGLRPLVFHVDAGWNTQIAVNNIERIIDSLDLDLFTEVIDWQEMRDLHQGQNQFLKEIDRQEFPLNRHNDRRLRCHFGHRDQDE